MTRRGLAPYSSEPSSRPVLVNESAQQRPQPTPHDAAAQAAREALERADSPYLFLFYAESVLPAEVIAACWDREEHHRAPGECQRHASMVDRPTQNTADHFVRSCSVRPVRRPQ